MNLKFLKTWMPKWIKKTNSMPWAFSIICTFSLKNTKISFIRYSKQSCHCTFLKTFSLFSFAKSIGTLIRRESEEPGMTLKILASLHSLCHNFEGTKQWRKSWFEVSALFLRITCQEGEKQKLGNFLWISAPIFTFPVPRPTRRV